jgi:hypothetical protein
MKYVFCVFLFSVFFLSACDSSSNSSSNAAPPDDSSNHRNNPSPSPKPSATPSPSPTSVPSPSPSPSPSSSPPVALIFNGDGTSPTDEQSLVSIAQSYGLKTQAVTSAQLEAMTASQLASYPLIIWPGGDSSTMSASLDAGTRERVREAVVNAGVNFVGFCAGAWIAIGPDLDPEGQPYWGLAIAPYAYVTEYYPDGPGTTEPVAAMVMSSFGDGTSRDLVWWGGPFLPTIPNAVVSKYPDGTAEMVELQAGNGFVVLSGVHPEAPEDWRTEENLVDTDGLDFDIAWKLMDAALTRTRLPTF